MTREKTVLKTIMYCFSSVQQATTVEALLVVFYNQLVSAPIRSEAHVRKLHSSKSLFECSYRQDGASGSCLFPYRLVPAV